MKKIYLIFIVLILLSCSKDRLTDSFTKIENISLSEVENFPKDSLMVPSKICSFQDNIILLEDKMNLLFASYNTKTNKFKRFQHKGRGENELLNIQQISTSTNSDEFYARSVYDGTIFTYSQKDDFSFIKSKIETSPNLVTLNVTSDGFIGMQMMKDKRFQQIKNNKKYEFGQNIEIVEYDPKIVSMFILGNCLYEDKLKRFAFFSMFGDVFEIYNCQSEPTLLYSFIGKLPIIDNSSTNPILSSDTKLGVLSATSSDKYIFALYADQELKTYNFKKRELDWHNKILVYDWNGSPIKILNIDVPVRDITYNKEQNRVYCIGKTEIGYNVFYFELSSI